MKAARFSGNNVVDIIEKPVPQIKENEVLVKVAYCGLCGSEKRVLRSGYDRCVPGHEISGTVESCGSKARPLAKGTPVLIYLLNYCGKCSACLERNTSQCSDRQGLIGWTFDGGYAEYVAVPEHMVFPIDPLPLHLGVIALDTIGTAFHGLRQSKIDPGHTVLVIGCGPIGLGCVSILKNHYKVKTVYAADISPNRCRRARALGAEAIVVDPADTSESIAQGLPVSCVDRMVEVSGLDVTVAASLRFVAPGGDVVFIGEPEKALTIQRSADWVLKDFRFINSWYFPVREIDDNIAFIRAYQANVEALVSDYFSLDLLDKAFEKFISGESAKVLIRF